MNAKITESPILEGIKDNRESKRFGYSIFTAFSGVPKFLDLEKRDAGIEKAREKGKELAESTKLGLDEKIKEILKNTEIITNENDELKVKSKARINEMDPIDYMNLKNRYSLDKRKEYLDELAKAYPENGITNTMSSIDLLNILKKGTTSTNNNETKNRKYENAEKLAVKPLTENLPENTTSKLPSKYKEGENVGIRFKFQLQRGGPEDSLERILANTPMITDPNNFYIIKEAKKANMKPDDFIKAENRRNMRKRQAYLENLLETSPNYPQAYKNIIESLMNNSEKTTHNFDQAINLIKEENKKQSDRRKQKRKEAQEAALSSKATKKAAVATINPEPNLVNIKNNPNNPNYSDVLDFQQVQKITTFDKNQKIRNLDKSEMQFMDEKINNPDIFTMVKNKENGIGLILRNTDLTPAEKVRKLEELLTTSLPNIVLFKNSKFIENLPMYLMTNNNFKTQIEWKQNI